MRVGRRKFSQMGGQTGNFSRKTGNLHENRRGNGPSSCFPVCFLFSCLAGDFGGSGDLKTARNGEFRAWKAENHLSRRSRREIWDSGRYFAAWWLGASGSGPGDPGFSHTTTRRLEGYGSWTVARNFVPLCLGVRRIGAIRAEIISHGDAESRRDHGDSGRNFAAWWLGVRWIGDR